MATSDRNETLTEKQAEEMFNAVMNFNPDIDDTLVEAIEKSMNRSGHMAVLRRLGLALAIKDGAWFKNLTTEREAAMHIAAQLPDISGCVQLLRELADLIEGAVARTEVALCGWEDIQNLKEEAKKFTLLQEAA